MRILVAEDNDLAALLIRLSLTRLGHEVTIARDGLEAWRMSEQSRFSVIISDWMMPRLDGPDLCRKIRRREGRPYCYIVLLTSKTSREERLEGLRAGADDFLIKPVNGDELAVRLEIAARILSVQHELERRNARLSEVALFDELTGLMNRRGFRESIERLFDRARQGRGALAGDPRRGPLQGLQRRLRPPRGRRGAPDRGPTLIRDSFRGHDGLSRIGGEEFAVLLPDSDAFVARERAEQLRAAIAGHPWPLRPITASLGIATDLARRRLGRLSGRAGRSGALSLEAVGARSGSATSSRRGSTPWVCH